MTTYRRTARTVGVCFLFSNVVFILGAVLFVEPIVGAPEYLAMASSNRTQLVVGVILELLNAVAYMGIAVLMFPILRRRFESMALWYVGFRAIEFVMQTLSGLAPLSLLTLGEELVRASGTDASALQAVSTLLLAQRYWAFQMVSITLVLGALVFYTALYRMKLIPRFISIWGLVGALAVLVNALLEWFGFTPGNFGILMLLNELFLAGWLIVKGFNPSAIPSGTDVSDSG